MNDILNKSSEYISRLFTEKLPGGSTYHNLNHVTEVVEAAREIGSNSGLNAEEMEMVLIAAWFHDSGIVDTFEEHELKSAEVCRTFLIGNQYPEDKIDKITSAIKATKVPQKPVTLIEKVLCDADLSHIGRKGLKEKTQLLREEMKNICGVAVSDFEWLKKNIEFVSSNKFHTDYAKKTFDERRRKNLEKLQKKMISSVSETPILNDIQENRTMIDETFKDEKKKEKVNRGIETMFRNVMRTHVEFSSMADNKANIMISVNTLLLTAIIAILIRKLDTNPHLIAPTAIITIVSLVTLIFAVIVTRPKITSGIFTKEDIIGKKANLLFFGNFFKMNLQDFEWGMNQMMKDQDYLYGSMIRDFYFLGQVLGQKYRYLRVCYNIFMYGIIISVIAFTIAIILYPEGTNLGPLIE